VLVAVTILPICRVSVAELVTVTVRVCGVVIGPTAA
jgi:hypothetical protein